MRIGHTRPYVADVPSVEGSTILLPDCLALFILVQGHVHCHAARGDYDVASVYELLGDVIALLCAVGVIGASYQRYYSGDLAQHKGRSHFSDLCIAYRPPAGSHLELLVLDVLAIGILVELQDRNILWAGLLASLASHTYLVC